MNTRTALVGPTLMVMIAVGCSGTASDKSLASGSSTVNQETTSPSDGATFSSNVEVLYGIVNAYNNDDAVGVLEVFVEGADVFGLGQAGDASTMEHLETIMTTVGDTVSLGPCEAGVLSNSVDCHASFEDDFHGPAGLTLEGIEHYYFDENGKIKSVSMSVDGQNPYISMETAMGEWMRNNYPEIYAQIVELDYWEDERMATMLEYVDEFVVASGEYPSKAAD